MQGVKVRKLWQCCGEPVGFQGLPFPELRISACFSRLSLQPSLSRWLIEQTEDLQVFYYSKYKDFAIKLQKLSISSFTNILFCVSVFPWWLSGKESFCNAGDSGLIPGTGRSPGEGNGNPLQYSCLENPMDRGAWWATVHGVAKSRTRLKRLST